MFEWVLAISGVIGAALNSCQKNKLVFISFIVWTLGNICWVLVFYHNKQYAQAFMFLAYLFSSLNGIRNAHIKNTRTKRVIPVVVNSIVRINLINRKGYTPFCGDLCQKMPRTIFNGFQFYCPTCFWVSDFPQSFIHAYKTKWGIK